MKEVLCRSLYNNYTTGCTGRQIFAPCQVFSHKEAKIPIGIFAFLCIHFHAYEHLLFIEIYYDESTLAEFLSVFLFSSDSISFFQFILSFHQIGADILGFWQLNVRFSQLRTDWRQIISEKRTKNGGEGGRGWIKVGEDDIPNGFPQLHKTLYRVHLFNNYSTISYEENLLRLKEQASVGSKTRSGARIP